MLQLDDIKGEYDIAISLGASCQTAEQLRKHGLRCFAGPFDWTVLESVPCLINAINNRFDNYFNIDNLTVQEKHDHTYLVFDKLYQCMSVHDFPIVDNESKIFDVYPEFIAKMQRRIDRFYDRIKKSKKTLFVRFHSNYEETKALQECLKVLTDNKFVLIILNETNSYEFIQEEWGGGLDNTFAARIYQTKEVTWKGYSPHWDTILGGISVSDFDLQSESILPECNILSERLFLNGWHNVEESKELGMYRWMSEEGIISINVGKPHLVLSFQIGTFNPRVCSGEKNCVIYIENSQSNEKYSVSLTKNEIKKHSISLMQGKATIRLIAEDIFIPFYNCGGEDLRKLSVFLSHFECR